MVWIRIVLFSVLIYIQVTNYQIANKRGNKKMAYGNLFFAGVSFYILVRDIMIAFNL